MSGTFRCRRESRSCLWFLSCLSSVVAQGRVEATTATRMFICGGCARFVLIYFLSRCRSDPFRFQILVGCGASSMKTSSGFTPASPSEIMYFWPGSISDSGIFIWTQPTTSILMLMNLATRILQSLMAFQAEPESGLRCVRRRTALISACVCPQIRLGFFCREGLKWIAGNQR